MEHYSAQRHGHVGDERHRRCATIAGGYLKCAGSPAAAQSHLRDQHLKKSHKRTTRVAYLCDIAPVCCYTLRPRSSFFSSKQNRDAGKRREKFTLLQPPHFSLSLFIGQDPVHLDCVCAGADGSSPVAAQHQRQRQW